MWRMPSASSSATHGPGRADADRACRRASRTARSCASTRNRRLMSTVVRCATVNRSPRVRPVATSAMLRRWASVLRDDGVLGSRSWCDRRGRRRASCSRSARWMAIAAPHRRRRRRRCSPSRAAARSEHRVVALGVVLVAVARPGRGTRGRARYPGRGRSLPGRCSCAAPLAERLGRCGCGWSVFVAVVVGAPVGVRRRPRGRRGGCLCCSCVSTIGIYVCVPDTEVPKVLLGAVGAGGVARARPTRAVERVDRAFVAARGRRRGGRGRRTPRRRRRRDRVPRGGAARSRSCGGEPASPAEVVVLVDARCCVVLYVARVGRVPRLGVDARFLCVPAFVIAWHACCFVTPGSRCGDRGQ